MSTRIFWAVTVGFLFGVFARSFLPLGWSFVEFLLLLCTASLAFGYVERSTVRTLIVFSVAFAACACGIARMQMSIVSGDPTLNAEVGKTTTLEGVVSREPDARETSTLVTVNVKSLIASSTIPVSGGVLVTMPAHANISYGDVVRISGKLELPEAFDTGLGRQFEYPQYLAVQGVQYRMGFAQVFIHGNSGNSLKAAAFAIKEAYLQGMRAALPEPEAGLAGGITVGDKRSIGPEVSAAFQRDSLIHMVVLSGYNITVVLNAITLTLRKLPRLMQFSGSIGIVVFFILMSGGASSAARAGLMALIAVFARATHRVYLGTRALALVACAMVAWNPLVLCFYPDFQLSALGTLSLIFP